MSDSTLASLLPGLPLHVANRRIELRPVTVEELPAVERIWKGWVQLVVTRGEELDPAAVEDLVNLLGSTSGQGVEWIKSLSEADFEQVLSHALALNEEVLNPPRMKSPETFTWAQIVQKLVRAGHPWVSVKGYTLSQVRAFIEVVAEQERDVLADALQASSFSMVSPQDTQKIADRIRGRK